MMNAIEKDPSASNELIAFRLGGQEFCVDIMSVRDIRGWTQTTPLPHSPDYVKGVINEFPVGPNSTRLSNAVAAVARRLNDSEVPSPHSVYRWLTRYVQSGYDVNALAKDAMTKRSRTPRLPEKVKKRLEECLLEELGADVGASIWGVTDKILEQIAVELEYDGFVTTRGSVTLLASAAKAASAEARP